MGRLRYNANAIVFLIILSLLLIPFASSRSIHQINQVDIFPQGDFENSDDWIIETQSGFSTLEAENSVAMVADGKLSVTHQRNQNLREMEFWSTTSPSGHDSAVGNPDGIVSISSGPDIDLSGFNFTSLHDYPLVNVSLLISFRISSGLNDDSVEFSVESSEGTYMIHTYSSTFSQGEINMLSIPYATYNLDPFYDWTWEALTTSSVKLNYESVGGSDEAQLEVDGVALKVTYQMPESGFDFIKAESQIQLFENYEYDDLTLNLSGNIVGDLGQINNDLSWIKLLIGSSIVIEENIDSNMSEIDISISLDEMLFDSIIDITFAIGIQLYWDSEGSSSDAVLLFDEISIDGVTSTDWDENPICMEIEDLVGNNSFIEDSGDYKIIPIIDNCNDDRTNEENLLISVTTNPEGIVQASIDDGHLKIFQIENSFGVAEIIVEVTDTSENTWVDSFLVSVSEINDSPEIINFPEEVWIELGKQLDLNGTIFDVETSSQNLEFSADSSVVTINPDYTLSLFSTELGVIEITLTLSDGNSIVQHKIILTTFSEADLEPISITVEPNEEKYSLGTEIQISTEIENSGSLDATFVSVRCYLNEQLIGNKTVALISSHSSKMVTFDWEITGVPGTYTIKISIDSSGSIQESNEMNNEYIYEVTIEGENSVENTDIESKNGLLLIYPLFFVIIGFSLLGLLLYFGPQKIRKIK
jgi:hypothetical protein